VSRVQPVKDGALLTFEIRSWPDDATKERLDRGHKGPCAVYLKKVDDASTDKAVGDGWFKIFDHGYDSATDRWCTDEIIDNNGLLSVHLPKGMEGGDYLARPEIIALHVANKDDPQTYTGCAQIFLESSGNLVPESTVSIPGYMKYGTPSTHFDIYNTDNRSPSSLPRESRLLPLRRLRASSLKAASWRMQTGAARKYPPTLMKKDAGHRRRTAGTRAKCAFPRAHPLVTRAAISGRRSARPCRMRARPRNSTAHPTRARYLRL
jgi:hypothetical protein